MATKSNLSRTWIMVQLPPRSLHGKNISKYRRLSKDYETDLQSSETMLRLAMINLMLHRLKVGYRYLFTHVLSFIHTIQVA